MDYRIKYVLAIFLAGISMVSGYFYPAETFIAFIAGWLFVIPAAFIAYLVYGYVKYMTARKHRIDVLIKPTGAIRAIARREIELEREKDTLYREFR